MKRSLFAASLLLLVSTSLVGVMGWGNSAQAGFLMLMGVGNGGSVTPPPVGTPLLLAAGTANLLLVNGTDNLCLASSSSC
jgi:hypothetical protein